MLFLGDEWFGEKLQPFHRLVGCDEADTFRDEVEHVADVVDRPDIDRHPESVRLLDPSVRELAVGVVYSLYAIGEDSGRCLVSVEVLDSRLRREPSEFLQTS